MTPDKTCRHLAADLKQGIPPPTRDGGLRIRRFASRTLTSRRIWTVREDYCRIIVGPVGPVRRRSTCADKAEPAATFYNGPAAIISMTPSKPCNKREPGFWLRREEGQTGFMRSLRHRTSPSPGHPSDMAVAMQMLGGRIVEIEGTDGAFPHGAAVRILS